MSKNNPIMQRIKSNYESRSRTFLTRRTPVIIRLDGKAFHTYTKNLEKPFDEGLIEDMRLTAKYLCENIQGCKLAYSQSDEISLLLTDYDNLNTDAWFDYNVQKIASISASMASAKFNQLRLQRHFYFLEKLIDKNSNEFGGNRIGDVRTDNIVITQTLSFFDSRVFNIPKEEVPNYFKARQRDAIKNSISMLAQSLYSHKELHGKNGSEMQEMTLKKGINWNDLDYSKKRGCTVKKIVYINDKKVVPYRKNQYTSENEFFADWSEIEIKSVRNKWENVETPLNFDKDYFEYLLCASEI